jgi:dihydrofolate reductase
MRLCVHEFVTLDGVMQGPGGPDEDRSNGFAYGGWLVPYADEDFGRIVDGWFADAEAILLGRTTYQMMQPYWSSVTDPGNHVATVLNTFPKYVASTTLTEQTASWDNSTVLDVSVSDRVLELKDRPGGELQVHGSWQLVRTLHDAGLIDVYRLMVFPVVVGEGKRLFEPGSVPSGFRTLSSELTATGVVSLVLEPAPLAEARTFVVEDGRETVA